MPAHILHKAEAAVMSSWQIDMLLVVCSAFFTENYALVLLIAVLQSSSQAGRSRAVLANMEFNIQNTNDACGQCKPQPSLSTVAEPAVGAENEDIDAKVTTSLWRIQGCTNLQCCHMLQLHPATVLVCIYGVSMHNMLAQYISLRVLGASTIWFAKPTCPLMQASDTDLQGASQAKVSEVNEETEVKSGPQSKTVGKSLKPRATRSRRQMHNA